EPCPFCMGDGGASPMRALGAVLADLADIGFDAEWCGLRAADVGAAHGRFRVFILAWPTAADTDSGAWGYSQSKCVAPGRSSGTASVEHGVGADSDSALVTLLPTPQARDWKDHQVQVAGHRPDDKDSINRAIAHLLPTPRTSDTNGAGVHGTGGQDLRTVIDLLPTPRARDHIREGYEAGLRRSSPQLETTAVAGVKGDINWGEYADAIARWERVLGRPAPDPTEPGPKGNPRLSPRFVEWLMGLPAGHVTDPAIGLTRNQQLKALGNGVVPAQGAAALEWLMSVEAVPA